jgi:3-phenylpropionate/cinnamic acid dioxygenase small subunit
MVTSLSWREWSSARNLQVRVAKAVDDQDWEELEGCFAADLKANLPNTGTHSDRASMIAKIRQVVERLDATQHFLSNHQIDRHEGGLRARCYVVATHVRTTADREFLYTFGGCYEDRIADGGNSLQIVQRQLAVVWTTGDPSVLQP